LLLIAYTIFSNLAIHVLKKYEELEKNQLSEEGRVLEDRVVFCKYTR
jgi:hypothetical protein